MALRRLARGIARPFVEFARRVDRRLFRRSVHLNNQMNDLRAELAQTQMIGWALMRRFDELTVQLEQLQRENRMGYVATRTLLESSDVTPAGSP